jgi:hypothetical protein
MMWNYIRGSFFFWFGLIFAVIGTPFLLISIYQFALEREIINNGVLGTATLVEKGHSSSRSSSSRYSLKYVFHDQGGVEHIREAKVKWEDWRRFQDGDTLPIRYIPDHPERNRLAGGVDQAWWILPLIFGVLGLIFGGLGWTCVVVALRKIRAELFLLRTGTAIEGDITEFDFNYQVTMNGRHPQYFRYRYEADGKRHQGRSPDLPGRFAGRWNPGDSIRIVYNPRDPGQSEADIYDLRRRG